MGLQPIAFWNLQNTYLAKHIQMPESTKKFVYIVLKIIWLSARINKFRADIY